jgi:hypothetical protein
MIMRQVRWASGTVALAMALAICGVGPAAGDVASDRAAAILMWPNVQVGDVTGTLSATQSIETVIQLTNTSDQPIVVWCFYENANSHCTNSGQICVEAQDCCNGSNGCGQCLPDWNEVDFRIRLTPQQPIGWLASEGEADFPLDGVIRTGVGGSSNAGSRIPPVPEDPFEGLLKCIAVDEDNVPVERNVLKGEATLYFVDTTKGVEQVDVAKYNAVGIQAREGRLNDDKTLILDSEQNPDAEYNGCPNVLILNHFFDFATNPVNGAEITTNLVLVPCTQDLLRQIPGSAVIQYIVYNEFEQRFSTSRTARCKQNLPISLIDTTQRERSIFSAGVAGTLTGQTRANAIGSGMLAVADEFHEITTDRFYSADFNVHFQGDREDPDTIILP